MPVTALEAAATFAEGLITFISPCVLPMLPVYVLYFAGGGAARSRGRTLLRALCFVLGFTAVFVLLGVFAGTLGALLVRHQRAVNAVCGLVMIGFGLHVAGVLHIAPLSRTLKPSVRVESGSCASCALLGAVFAAGWSPCTGPFLGSAMMLAAGRGQAAAGVALLLCYAMGLGVPFLLCALLMEELRGAFDVIKRHYTAVNRVCGAFLVVMGALMATGMLTRLTALLA